MTYRFSLAALSALLLSACGSVYNGPTQDVTLLTPGAENAQCTLHNDDFRYTMRTDETRSIMRSEEGLIVKCYAPANREKTIVVERELSNAGQANIANLGLGALYDYYDNALYEYPEVIIVDFTTVAARSYGLPAAHASDLPHPVSAPVTSYAPTTPVTDFDRSYPQPILQKKSEIMDDMMLMGGFMPEPSADTSPMSVMPAPIKAPSGSNAEELTRSMNPSVFQ